MSVCFNNVVRSFMCYVLLTNRVAPTFIQTTTKNCRTYGIYDYDNTTTTTTDKFAIQSDRINYDYDTNNDIRNDRISDIRLFSKIRSYPNTSIELRGLGN